MSVETSLKSIGLNYREIQVYLATLELGGSTVTPISHKSGFKRTYCYDILEELKKQGLVNYVEKNGRRNYFAEDPKKIEDRLSDNLSNFQTLLPELRSIYNNKAEKPRIRYYEGKEGIISVYLELLKVASFDAIASPGDITKNLGEFFSDYAKKQMARKVKIREIITEEGTLAEYIRQYKKPLQEARLLPREVALTTDMLIYENKLAMISYVGDLHAVVIESSSIVDTQKALFEIIWESAQSN